MLVFIMMSAGHDRHRDTTGDDRLDLAAALHPAAHLQQVRERHSEGQLDVAGPFHVP